MKLSKNQVSRHAIVDRADRLSVIGATVGFGTEVLRERYSPEKESWSCFMDSGAMLIWSKNHEKLVTGFIPTKAQVIWVYGRPVNHAIERIVEIAQNKYAKGVKNK